MIRGAARPGFTAVAAVAPCVAAALLWAAPARAEIVLWHTYHDAEQDGLEQAIEAYNAAHPDDPIRPQALPFSGFASKLRSAIPRGNGPDLFVFAHEPIGGWVDAGLVAPVALPDGLLPQAAAAVHYEGADYAFPVTCKALALYHNRALVPEPPADRQALLRVAREQTTGDRFGLAYDAADTFLNLGAFFGAGGRFFDDHGAIALDTPAYAGMLDFARTVVVEEQVCPEEASYVLVQQLFNDGRAAMVINGPWFLSGLDPALDLGVAPLPAPAVPPLSVEGVFVSAHATDPGAAMAAAAELAGPAYDRYRIDVGRQVVARPHEYDDPVQEAFHQAALGAVPTPNRPEMPLVWEPTNAALRKVLRGAATPEEAAAFAQRRAEILNRPLPPEANPAPTLLIVGVLLLAAVYWIWRRSRGQQVWTRMKQGRTAYAYLAPAALGMGLLLVLPFLTGSALSLFAHRAGEFRFVGLSNFASILFARDYPITDPLSFYFTLAVTTLWTGANVVLHVSIGMSIALLLRDPWMKLRGFYRVMLIVPWAVPNYITALIWKGMFNKQFGAINGLLSLLGLEPVAWFSQFWTALAANICTNTWLGFPFMMVVTLGALQAIPRDLEEAAEVDGASRWQRFRHVTLPLLKPALLPAVILGTIWTFNMFNIVFLVSGGEPDGGTEILISEAYKWAFSREAQYGYAAAYATLIFGVLLLYTFVTDRIGARAREDG